MFGRLAHSAFHGRWLVPGRRRAGARARRHVRRRRFRRAQGRWPGRPRLRLLPRSPGGRARFPRRRDLPDPAAAQRVADGGPARLRVGRPADPGRRPAGPGDPVRHLLLRHGRRRLRLARPARHLRRGQPPWLLGRATRRLRPPAPRPSPDRARGHFRRAGRRRRRDQRPGPARHPARRGGLRPDPAGPAGPDLPQRHRRPPAAAHRRPGRARRVRAHPPGRRCHRHLRLRREHHLAARAGAGHRLQPPVRQPLPRRAGGGQGHRGVSGADDADGRRVHLLQRQHRAY